MTTKVEYMVVGAFTGMDDLVILHTVDNYDIAKRLDATLTEDNNPYAHEYGDLEYTRIYTVCSSYEHTDKKEE